MKTKEVIRKILYGVAFCIVILAFVFLGQLDYKKNVEPNKKIASEYKYVDDNNCFEEIDIDKAIKVAKGSGVILFSKPDKGFSDYYAGIISKACLGTNIDKIYLYNSSIDRVGSNKKFNKLIEQLNDVVVYDDNDEPHIFMPTIVFIKDGNIVNFDNESAVHYGKVNVRDYWTTELENEKINTIKGYIDSFVGAESNE